MAKLPGFEMIFDGFLNLDNSISKFLLMEGGGRKGARRAGYIFNMLVMFYKRKIGQNIQFYRKSHNW
jgi:hypothetical protein